MNLDTVIEIKEIYKINTTCNFNTSSSSSSLDFLGSNKIA
ncbi:hypothetical protein OKW23_000668 [Bacilli bacterium PM5-9]|nr:hypothetical protein [Bacilli bacterium PM5-9]